MPANKYALIRYRTIDRCLRNEARPFPSKEELRAACEEALYGSDGDHISTSTLEKDLNAMRYDGALGYYAPIAYHRDERGYYYEEEDFSIDNLQLNDEELESIRFAARTLVQFRNVPMFSQFGQAIGKIDDRLRMAPDLDTAQLDSIVQFESAPATRGSEHLQPLLHAIQGRRVVSLSYRKFKSEGADALLVHPYLLKEYRNRWYLIAWNNDRSDYRTYGLDRMESVEEQDETFAVRSDFDADHFFKHSFGISKSTEAPQNVRVRCNQLEYEYLSAQPVHPSQQLVRIDEDVYELQLHVLVTFELVHFLLGLGAAVEVIAPESLRQRMEAVHRAALDRYQ
jgi:predicted DNA-binding transcriptional regulator YafY